MTPAVLQQMVENSMTRIEASADYADATFLNAFRPQPSAQSAEKAEQRTLDRNWKMLFLFVCFVVKFYAR
jgi:hypothetical protein